jgi:uncharacterized membrane protein YphA (DoxX/SURF4 family)
MHMSIYTFDQSVIKFFQKYWIPAARVAMAVVFIWFGMLKVLHLSPAGGLVQALFESSIHFMTFAAFYTIFAWFEVIIGVLFLIPRATRIVIPLLFIHMVTTFGPLVLLPGESWSAFMVPTLVGQYIIKNLVLIAVAMGIAAHVSPLKQ